MFAGFRSEVFGLYTIKQNWLTVSRLSSHNMKHRLLQSFYPLCTSVFTLKSTTFQMQHLPWKCLYCVSTRLCCLSVRNPLFRWWGRWSGFLDFTLSFQVITCLYHTQIKCAHTAASWAPASKVVTPHSGESKEIMRICKVQIKQTHMTIVSAHASFNKRPYSTVS